VGASRGAFVKGILAIWPDLLIDAVEPDASVTDWWADTWQNVLMHRQGIEAADIKGKFDLIYASHTLEHLNTPLDSLRKLHSLLSPSDGWLLVEVPNLRGLMGIEDIVEEIYIDKHVSHFTSSALQKMLKAAGFRPLFHQADEENLTILAAKATPLPVAWDAEPALIAPMIKQYAGRLAGNLKALKGRVATLNKRIKGKTALLHGGGRILSALVASGLDVSLFDGIIDSYLPLEEVYGLPVLKSEMLGIIAPETVLICSRGSAGEMETEVRRWRPEAEMILWWNG
jgi:hypothetical protein